MPRSEMKVRMKWLWSKNPTPVAMSAIVRWVVSRSCRASRMRNETRYRFGEVLVTTLKSW